MIYRDSKKMPGLPGVKEQGEVTRQTMEDFQGSETTLNDPIKVETCH